MASQTVMTVPHELPPPSRVEWTRRGSGGEPATRCIRIMLTDLPIGGWTMATLLRRGGCLGATQSVNLLVTIGAVAAVAAVAAAATRLHNWSDTSGPEPRDGASPTPGTAACSAYPTTTSTGRPANRFHILIVAIAIDRATT